MAAITIPNRPLGSDTRVIAQILADFDAILAQANGNLESSTNVKVGVSGSTLDGNASAEGSSSSLARADHTHMIQGVERRAADPTTSNFVGRLYFNTTTERLMYCIDTGGSGTFIEVLALESGNDGAMVYVDNGVPVWTAAPTADQILRSVADVPTWQTIPYAVVQRTANQTIANVTDSTVDFTATDIADTAAMHDPASNPSRITAPSAGLYAFGAAVDWGPHDPGAQEQLDAWFRMNGSTPDSLAKTREARPDPTAGQNVFLNLNGMYPLAANDYIELRVRHNSGGNETLTAMAWMARIA